MSKDEAKKEQKRPQYFIAKGVEATTKRGQLKPGTQVFPKDFPCGQSRINELLKIKALVEK